MIFNIIDSRNHPYRWKEITAIVEPTHHDNSVENSDQADISNSDFVYDERASISLCDAIAWALSLPFGATLYLYDVGNGINTIGAL